MAALKADIWDAAMTAPRSSSGSPSVRVELRFGRPAPATWVAPVLEVCVEQAIGIREVRFTPPETATEAEAPGPGVVAVSLADLAAIEDGKTGTRVRLGGFTWTLPKLPFAGPVEQGARLLKDRASVLAEIAATGKRLAEAPTHPAAHVSATGIDGMAACQDVLDVIGALRSAGFAQVAFIATSLPVKRPAPTTPLPPEEPGRVPPATDAAGLPPAVATFLGGWAAPEGAATDKATGYPAKIRRTKDEMVMVLIPAGTFQMGAVPSDGNASKLEKPRHPVTLTKAYYMDEHEVTNGQFSKFFEAKHDYAFGEADEEVWGLDDGGSLALMKGISWRKPRSGEARPKDWDRHPVVLVTWNEADAYAAWVGPRRVLERPPTEAVGLPTEAQFERALRGGIDGELYPWGNSPHPPVGAGNYGDETTNRRYLLKQQERWYGPLVGYDDGFLYTAPVKSFHPNRYGLYDMSGNVWELCWDRAGTSLGFSTTDSAIDPVGPDQGSRRLVRGNSFIPIDWGAGADAGAPRSSNRSTTRYDDRCINIGFRCARSLP